MGFSTRAGFFGISIFALTTGMAQAQSAATGASASSPQIAESTDLSLDEVVVTAQRRQENVQSIPISIDAYSGRQLQELGVTTPADLENVSAGVFVTPARGDQNPVFSIRGISLNDTFSNNNPEVGIYVDEVNLPYTPMMSFQLFDLERVEVLKGPQGTLYGRNTTAGAINFISVQPTQQFDAYVTGTYSSWQHSELEGAVGGGLTDTLAARLSVKTVHQESGWQYNTTTDQTIGSRDGVDLRAQLLWTPTSRLSVGLEATYDYDKEQPQERQHVGYYAAGGGGYCAAALAGYRDENTCVDLLGYSDKDPDPRHVADGSLYGSWSYTDAVGMQVKVDYDLGWSTLTSISGYHYLYRTSPDDSDGAPLIELDSLFRDDIDSGTQELRLTSKDGGLLSWVGGLYYSRDRIKGEALQALDDFPFHTRVDTSFDQITKSDAAFGQGTYEFIPGLKLTGGVRYTRDEKHYDYDARDLNTFGDSSLPPTAGSISNHVNQSNVSGKAAISYNFDPTDMAYISYSRGYKAGGFKAAIAFSPEELVPFRGETVDAYEVGLKSSWLSGMLTVDAAAYLNNWKNFQASITIIEDGVSVLTLANAGNARTDGVEFTTVFRPTDRLSFRLLGNFMHSEITQYNSANGTADYTGNPLANAPNITGSAQVRFVPWRNDQLNLYVDGDYTYRSLTYFSLAERKLASQSGYGLLNGRVGLETRDHKWDVAFFAKNITNKLYITQSYDNFGGAFPSSNFLGDPISFGGQITYRY
jgi:iron complex outermembrane receptor protein